jgi:hypothetical protein
VGETPIHPEIRDAIDWTVESGRGGRGTTVFFASGNGGNCFPPDSLDLDGTASYEKVVAVGAVTDQGPRASYSEGGQALDLVAPSDGGMSAIVTTYTDVSCRTDLYTSGFGGTSAANPSAGSIGALLVSAVPALRPDKVQRILEDTARKVGGPYDGNGFSESYGYGMVQFPDALAEVLTGVTLDRTLYECIADDVVVSVRDDAAAGSGSVAALVRTTDGGGSDRDEENVICIEVAGRPGLFEAVVPTGWSDTPVYDDGTLVVGAGDTVLALYAGPPSDSDTAVGACSAVGCVPPDFGGLTQVQDETDCTGEGIHLAWDAPADWGSGAPGVFNVYRSQLDGFDPGPADLVVSLPSTAADHRDDDPALLPQTTYYYVVRAESDEAGCGGPARDGAEEKNGVQMSGSTGIAALPVPSPPEGLRVAGTDPSVVTWEPVSGDTFRLYRGSKAHGDPLLVEGLECLARDLPDGTGHPDPDAPLPGGVLLYLAAAENACHVSAFGPADVLRADPPDCP